MIKKIVYSEYSKLPEYMKQWYGGGKDLKNKYLGCFNYLLIVVIAKLKFIFKYCINSINYFFVDQLGKSWIWKLN